MRRQNGISYTRVQCRIHSINKSWRLYLESHTLLCYIKLEQFVHQSLSTRKGGMLFYHLLSVLARIKFGTTTITNEHWSMLCYATVLTRW